MVKNQAQYGSFRLAYKIALPDNIHSCEQDVNALFELTRYAINDLGLTVAEIPLSHYEDIGKIAASITKGLPAEKVGDDIIIPTQAIVNASKSSIVEYLQEIIDSGVINAQEDYADQEYDMSTTENVEIPYYSEADNSCLTGDKPAETNVEINRLKGLANRS